MRAVIANKTESVTKCVRRLARILAGIIEGVPPATAFRDGDGDSFRQVGGVVRPNRALARRRTLGVVRVAKAAGMAEWSMAVS
jgi:hypothetical protein